MLKRHLFGTALSVLTLYAGQALAAEPAATPASTTTDTVDTIIVLGQGQSRSVQTVKTEQIGLEAAGSSPLKAIEKLPGVNFQSADAFGSYEWSTRISIRGFNQNQLGFTLDGVPLGDMSYGNFNGLHISRAISTEDVGSIDLAQGAGGLDTASTSNLGGTLKFSSRRPSDDFGVLAAATGGSNSMYRAFVRVDSGELSTGTRGYISYANQQTDKWKGYGKQKQQQADIKVEQALGTQTLTGFYDWSRRRENDYQDMSLDMISRLGYNWDNDSDNYAEAIKVADVGNNTGYTGAPVSNAAAGTVYPTPFANPDDAYFDAAGLRNDELYSVKLAGPISDSFKYSAMVYGHKNKGQGLWYTPYVPSPNGVPISVRTTEYDIDRKGFVGNATYTIGDHAIGFGGWYEDNDFNQARRFYGLKSRTDPGYSSLKFRNDPFYTQWAYAFNTKTKQAYVEDVWSASDALKINFGFKALKVDSDSTTVVGTGSSLINGSITSKDSFLPQVGVNYKLNSDSELFGSYSENIRAFGAAHTGISPFATTQAGFDAIKNTLKPESSKTFEGGWRYRTGAFQGVIDVYHVKFDNRLIGTTAGSGIVGNPTILANAGSVTSKGFEAAGTYNFTPAWSLFGSYAYNDSSYDDDVGVYKLSGKTVVDTPKSLFNLELAYDADGWYAKLGGRYTAKRYFTYTNDKSVPSYTLVDLTAGYRFQGEGFMKGLEIQANVTNLLDKKYVATLGSNGFGYSGDNQTLLPGAPRQGFVTVKKQF
jgi:iron complex outermembrane receptor protein